MILSGYADMRALVAAINEAHIQSYLGKPWDDDELRSSLAQALALYDKMVESEGLADMARSQQGVISPHEAALKQLEAKNPALVRVNWAPNGGVMLEHDEDE
jgi:response regulator RpfG family c-di-GMP phosphodiesterase